MIPDFAIVLPLYALNFFLPQIVKAMGFTLHETGFIVALPYLLAMGAMILLGPFERPQRQPRRTCRPLLLSPPHWAWRWRRWRRATSWCWQACAWRRVEFMPRWRCSGLCRRRCCAAPRQRVGWRCSTASPTWGGFFGPSVMGWVKQNTGSFNLGMAISVGNAGAGGACRSWRLGGRFSRTLTHRGRLICLPLREE